MTLTIAPARRFAVAARVIVLALAATVATVAATSDPSSRSLVSPWRTFTDPGFSFRVEYPSEWRVIPDVGRNPSGVERFVYLGTVAVTDSCRTEASRTRCSSGRHAPLPTGDVLLSWSWNSGPLAASVDRPIRAHGTSSRIDGRPAWIYVHASSECPGRVIDVSVDAGASVVMSACVDGPGGTLDRLQALVLRSVRSVHIGT